MPELPEVETTRRGLTPHVIHQTIADVVVRHAGLRHGVPSGLRATLRGQVIETVGRRGKYLLFGCARGTLIVHLGMSGSLRIVPATTAPAKHDHLDIVLASGRCLRLRDPRRFGSVLWTEEQPASHKLLRALGPEPLTDEFDGAYLHRRAEGRKVCVKSFIMDSHVVVGVGNIYASEALFAAGISPLRPAGRVSGERYARLAVAIKQILGDAIAHGGTTLRDFLRAEGEPGYFRQQLQVYGRMGEPCRQCGGPIRLLRTGQRATYYCPRCQR